MQLCISRGLGKEQRQGGGFAAGLCMVLNKGVWVPRHSCGNVARGRECQLQPCYRLKGVSRDQGRVSDELGACAL